MLLFSGTAPPLYAAPSHPTIGWRLIWPSLPACVCRDCHTAAVDAEGRLYTWGWGGSFFSGLGGLGHGDDAEQPTPKLVQGVVRYVRNRPGRASLLDHLYEP
jgi:hypothetical protein